MSSDTCSSGTDSQYGGEELTVLEACLDCDEDALYNVLQDGGTSTDQVNEVDKSGRVCIKLVRFSK